MVSTLDSNAQGMHVICTREILKRVLKKKKQVCLNALGRNLEIQRLGLLFMYQII